MGGNLATKEALNPYAVRSSVSPLWSRMRKMMSEAEQSNEAE
jgi:hypothetical protein